MQSCVGTILREANHSSCPRTRDTCVLPRENNRQTPIQTPCLVERHSAIVARSAGLVRTDGSDAGPYRILHIPVDARPVDCLSSPPLRAVDALMPVMEPDQRFPPQTLGNNESRAIHN